MATTDYAGVSQRTKDWAAVEMLDHAEPVVVLGKFGLTKPVPANTAEGVKFRRPVPFPVGSNDLVEGVTPTPKQMQYEDVQVTLKQKGDVVEIVYLFGGASRPESFDRPPAGFYLLTLQRQRPCQPVRAGHTGIPPAVDEDVLAMRRRIVVAQGGLKVSAGRVERTHVEQRRAVPVVGLHP